MIFNEKITVDIGKELYNSALERHSIFRSISRRAHQQYLTGLTGHERDSSFGLIYNATRELVDAQLRVDIPVPMVKPQIDTKRNRKRARAISAMLRSEMQRLPMEALNDMFERESHISGGSVAVVEYRINNSYNRGEITLKHVSATDFIPQPDIDTVDDMDYYFIVQDVTKSSVIEQYGERFRGQLENEGVAVESEGEGANYGSAKNSDEIVTLILMFYKLLGRWAHIAWVGDLELANMDDYYARKDNICTDCGSVMTDVCLCGGKKSVLNSRDGKPINTPLTTGYHTIEPNIPLLDELGEPIYEEGVNIDPVTGKSYTVSSISTKPRLIPYYSIKAAPISIRRNGTVAGQIFGSSDCESIRSLQEGMNIASTKIQEKMINSGYIMTKPESMSFELSNVMGRVLSVEAPDQLAMMKSIAFEFNSQADYFVLDKSYQYAKAVLAVTDSYQGKQDVTAMSGRAKEAQIAQSAGIHRVLQSLKNDFYSTIYRAIFQAMLAFDDSERIYTDINGTVNNSKHSDDNECVFRSIDFLELDENGDLFYEDRFNFSVDETGVNPNNRSEVLQYITQDFSAGLYGDPQTSEARLNLWRERQYLDFPGSARQVEYWERKIEEEKLQPEKGGEINGPTQNSRITVS